jgi:hypothetical protein
MLDRFQVRLRCLELAACNLQRRDHEVGEQLVRAGLRRRLCQGPLRQLVSLVPAAELEQRLGRAVEQVGVVPVPGEP